MSVRVEVVCLNPDGAEQRREVLTVDARELAMETLGLSLSEGKALLAGVQDIVIAQQVYEHLEQHRVCPHCHSHYTSKDSGNTPVSTVSVVLQCRIRAGTAAVARQTGQRRSARSGRG